MFKSFSIDPHVVLTYILASCMLVGVLFPTLWITHPGITAVVGFVAKMACGSIALLLLRDHISLRYRKKKQRQEYERNGFI